MGSNLANFGACIIGGGDEKVGSDRGKKVLSWGFDYGTWDLTLALLDFFMPPSVVNKEGGRHVGTTSVLLRVGECGIIAHGHQVVGRNYLTKPSILLVLTTMSPSGAKPLLKLLALGNCYSFSLSTMPVAN